MSPNPATPEPNAEISDLLAGGSLALPSPAGAQEALGMLSKAGRRGKLPGFKSTGPASFRIDCDAVPFEYELRGGVEGAGSAGSSIRLSLVRKRLLPTVFAVTLILTVWPGVWLTDSLIGTYWGAYGRWSEAMPWLTYAWYLPTTALPLPWMWRSLVRKSRAGATESAARLIPALRSLIAGDLSA